MIRLKIGKLDLIKMKNFCSGKGAVKGMKRQAAYWRKYLQITYLTKDLYPEYRKNL